MAELNLKEVQIIHDFLVENGITYESLHIDLLDHICCMVEEKMDNGLDFSESLTLSLSTFGVSNIFEIQENTIYLLTLKLNKMKKSVGILGCLSALSVIFGVLFKIQHWPGAHILLTIGVIITTLVVFPMMAYIDFKSSQNNIGRAHALTGYISAMLLCMATLVKIVKWPDFHFLYYMGISILIFVFLPLHTWRNYKIAENKIMAFARSLLIVAGVTVFWGLVRI
jgi:hypothetical protein